MDHLPIKGNSKAYSVRCFCSINDIDPFIAGYPEHKGWLIQPGEAIGRLDGTPTTSNEIVAFIQEWLFFGLLKDALKLVGIQVNLCEFVRHEFVGPGECGQRVITTATLPAYLDEWDKRESDVDQARKIECQMSMMALLNPLQQFQHFLDYSAQSVSIDSNVLLSIFILGETLRSAAMYIWRLSAIDYPLRGVSLKRKANPLTDRILQSGRCISESVMLHNILNNTGLWVASLVSWPKPSTQRCHDACTKTQCVALDVAEATYQTAHATNCPNSNGCPFVSVDQDKLVKIISLGDIPLVKLKFASNRNNTFEVKLHSSSSGAPYVAISHVWGHGLGNPKSNSLPRCQLLHLHQLVSTLMSAEGRDTTPLFWIDSLCIPVNPIFKEFRRTSIANLAETFSIANLVLILDAELQQASFNPLNRAEFATRMLCSGWMRRLWTLEEALLTQKGRHNMYKLWIQTCGRPVAFGQILQQDMHSLYYSEKAIHHMFSMFPPGHSLLTKFHSLSHALEYRTTSKPADEAICLAGILGLDIRSVARAGDTSEPCMCALFSQITELPAEIVFYDSEGLKTKGFRWAPQSLLNWSPAGSKFTDICRRDVKGLHGQFPRFIIETEIERQPGIEHFHFIDPEDSTTTWEMYPATTYPFPDSQDALRQQKASRAKFDDVIEKSKRVGLIWISEKKIVINAVCLRLEEKEISETRNAEDEIIGTYLFRANLFKRASRKKEFENSKGRNGVGILAKGVSKMQNWCIR